jgi:type III secretion protein L
MNLFTSIKEEKLELPPKKKVIPAEEFSQLLSAAQIVAKTKEEATAYRLDVAKECETLKELAKADGFQEGENKWARQIELLEKEIKNVRQEMENAIVPLALTAVKKIIGKELETKPETIVDVVSTALKTVSQHRRITVYVNQLDLEHLEKQRPRLKALFEHLETLTLTAREDIQPGGCIIETEIGIINAQLDSQFQALELAFRHFFQNLKQNQGG